MAREFKFKLPEKPKPTSNETIAQIAIAERLEAVVDALDQLKESVDSVNSTVFLLMGNKDG